MRRTNAGGEEHALQLPQGASVPPAIEAHSASPVHPLTVLSPTEGLVLKALSERGRRLTVGQLAARTGCSRADVDAALSGLKAKGLIACLNTVVASYSCRFPGLDMGGVAEGS